MFTQFVIKLSVVVLNVLMLSFFSRCHFAMCL